MTHPTATQPRQTHATERARKPSAVKRVLVLTSTFPRSDQDFNGHFVRDACAGLVSQGWDVIILAPHAPGSKWVERSGGMKIYRFVYAPPSLERLAYGAGIMPNLRYAKWKFTLVPGFLLAQLCWSLVLVTRYRPQIIHAHWAIPQGFWAVLLGRLTRRNSVVTVHGTDVFGVRGMVQRIVTWVLRRADAITVNSPETQVKTSQVAGQPVGKIIYMGFDACHFSPEARDDGLRHHWKAPVILFVGRMIQSKGVRILAQAFAKLPGAATLVWVGEGEERVWCETFANSLPAEKQMVFAGTLARPDVGRYMASSDVLVCPSLQAEGLGLVAAEALACGLPVVASDLGGMREVLDHGRAGWLVPPGDPEALSRAIREVLAQPEEAQRRTRHGRERSLRLFTWPEIAKQFNDLFESVV